MDSMSRNKDPLPGGPKDYGRQERLIEEKRKIFLAKKAGMVPAVPVLNSSDSKTTNSAEKLPFANDGSFFQQFLQMKTPPSPEAPPPVQTPAPMSPPLPSSAPPDLHPPIPSPPPVKLKLAAVPHPNNLPAPIPIFQSNKSLRQTPSDSQEKVSDFELADRMARQLALSGEDAIKSFKREEYKRGPLHFLSDASHPANVYFNQKLLEYQQTDKRVVATDSAKVSTPRRKTRWSSENETVILPPTRTPAPLLSSSALSSQQQQQQREVQSVLNKIADSIRGRGRGRGRGVKRFTGPRFEYDSEEENETGTWEHKRRAVEMEKTRESAEILTELGKGKHHLSDYLPGDEYLRFMGEVEKAQSGDQLPNEDSDYKDNEIREDNIGYKMLQRAGWQEGQGLGAQQQGIVSPVNKGRSSLDTTGVGSNLTRDVTSNDDEFSLYRKRMMLAYKFRPNPLNNPRRPYYD